MKKQTQSDTKQKIITAFLDLMREIEFDDINVKEIALKANVGRATFYRHFKQKQDIVIVLFENFVKKHENFFSEYNNYHDLVCCILSLCKKNVDLFRIIQKSKMSYLLFDYINNAVSSLFKKNGLGTDKYTSAVHAGSIFGICSKWIANDCADAPTVLCNTICAIPIC